MDWSHRAENREAGSEFLIPDNFVSRKIKNGLKIKPLRDNLDH